MTSKNSIPTTQPDDQRSAEQAAYEYLANVLNASWSGHLEIEILPPQPQVDEFAIRIVENSIGVPQTLLLLAFQYARLLFLSGLPQARSRGLDKWDDFQVRSLSAYVGRTTRLIRTD